MKNINEQLQDLYLQNWKGLSNEYLAQISDATLMKKPTNPLLLKIDEQKYNDANIKIMIFGQETNDWGGDFSGNIDASLNTYDQFFNTGECFSYRGQFWNGYKKIRTMIDLKFSDKNIYYMWNNIIKTGMSGEKNAPSDFIYNAELKYFNVIGSELEIIKPDVIVFFTGPNYDQRIQNALPNANFSALISGLSVRRLAKISGLNSVKMYRTYHPNFLYRNGIVNFLKPIVENL